VQRGLDELLHQHLRIPSAVLEELEAGFGDAAVVVVTRDDVERVELGDEVLSRKKQMVTTAMMFSSTSNTKNWSWFISQ
jgi:hypothetical protein